MCHTAATGFAKAVIHMNRAVVTFTSKASGTKSTHTKPPAILLNGSITFQDRLVLRSQDIFHTLSKPWHHGCQSPYRPPDWQLALCAVQAGSARYVSMIHSHRMLVLTYISRRIG